MSIPRTRSAWASCLIAALIALGLLSSRAIDLDGDGMSDVWQQKYSVPSADANLDYNGNGLTNTQKSLLGLDPRDPNSRFHLEITRDQANNELRLRTDTTYGKLYQLENSTDLTNWTVLGPLITGTGSPIDIITTLPDQSVSALFFRARFAGDVDADGDGLTAWEELQFGTSDNNSDTDGDGISDAAEFQNGTSPADYFNGQTPALNVVSGDNQTGAPDDFVSEALIVSVSDSNLGYALSNAPVTFSVTQGGGHVQASSSASPADSITLRTDANGEAKVYFKLPNSSNHSCEITVSAGSGSQIAQLTFTEASDDGTNGPYISPFAPSNVIGYVNADGSEDITWQNNADDDGPISISRQQSDGTWLTIATLPARTTSYHAPSP